MFPAIIFGCGSPASNCEYKNSVLSHFPRILLIPTEPTETKCDLIAKASEQNRYKTSAQLTSRRPRGSIAEKAKPIIRPEAGKRSEKRDALHTPLVARIYICNRKRKRTR